MFKSAIMLIYAFVSLSFCQNYFRTDRIDIIEYADVSSGDDSTVLKECRAIKADVGGEVKLKIDPKFGSSYVTVEYLPDGIWVPVGNVVRVYQYITGTTEATCQVYDTTGTAVTGIKLGK